MNGIFTNEAATALSLAVIFDVFFGDPAWFYHPVRIIGDCATFLERFLRRVLATHLRIAGMLLALIIVGGTFALTEIILIMLSAISPWLGALFNILGMYTALAINSLSVEGWAIRKLIRKKDIAVARERVALLVSRNMREEGEQGIIRATLETITENTSDAVIAPLFFAMIGGAPLALAYKAINTLDSMIGYRDETYRDFGWFAARLDDIANLIPARITGVLFVINACVLGKHPLRAVRAWWRDAQKGPSPNGGIPITTFAGALSLRLGGDCTSKDGQIISIPHVGGNRRVLVSDDIAWANIFLYVSTALFMGAYLLVYLTST